jgi:glycosyltransferase involved in cell wall biosynthesis
VRLVIAFYFSNIIEDFEALFKEQENISSYAYKKYVIESMIRLTEKVEEVIVLDCCSDRAYDVELSPGFRVVGTGFNPWRKKGLLAEVLTGINPTHLIVRAVIREAFKWASVRAIPTAACLADSFELKGLKNRIDAFFWAKQLNEESVEWVGNHGINSCLNLQQIGVNSGKIIPWDYPHTWDSRFTPKQLRYNPDSWNLAYVGSIHESKGVGDVLRGVKIISDNGIPVRLHIAGRGDIDEMEALATKLGIVSLVSFLGAIPNNQVVELMNQSDIVLIPSRREYGEGFPLTIFEALKSRTPIVASDHPMFHSYLRHRETAMVFPSGKHVPLAKRIEELISDQEIYLKLSTNSEKVWQDLQIPIKLDTFTDACVDSWMDNPSGGRELLYQHCLSSGLYHSSSSC